jgi:integrase/recombinase XerD
MSKPNSSRVVPSVTSTETENEAALEEEKRLRTGSRKKARELAKYLRDEHPDYAYLKNLFYYLRLELSISVPSQSKKLPYVPTEEEIKRYYEVVWQSQNFCDLVLIKTLLYTGVRVSELCNIKLSEVDLEQHQIRINHAKGGKDRVVPFPVSFKEVLGLHIVNLKQKQATFLFESRQKRKYSERGVRRMLERYGQKAGLSQTISPHKLRHFLLTWLKKQGLDDALIQPYSGHTSRQSLEIYSKLAIGEAQKEYNQVIGRFPV